MKPKTRKSVIQLTFLILVISLVGYNAQLEHPKIISPLPMNPNFVYAVEEIVKNPTSEQQQIISEIKQVFGPHADKALQLLTDSKCAENRRLNPLAMNDNGDSQDWGIFQINNKWQGVTNKAFLTDYKINIRMAWNIYSRDGYSFKLWTCGRELGI